MSLDAIKTLTLLVHHRESTETQGRGGCGVRSLMNLEPCPQRLGATSRTGLHLFKVLHVLMDEINTYKDMGLYPGVPIKILNNKIIIIII